MKSSQQIKTIIIETVCLLYVLLFAYAAISKLLDFENFQIQLGQSPLLSAYASYIAWIVPASEIIIVLLLLFSKFKYEGLLLAYSLMIMFTTYIIIILNFSPFVPCSCGGVLSKLGWTEHLIFNIAFAVMAFVGVVLHHSNFEISPAKKYILNIRNKSAIFLLVVTGSISAVFIISLYLLSENEIHRNNSFIRRYPHHPVAMIKGYNVKYNSYYIAGAANGRIYLGNTTAPRQILVIDTLLTEAKTLRVQVEGKQDYPFKSVQVRVKFPYFYLADGTVPVVYRGKISNWRATPLTNTKNYFSAFEPIDSTLFAIRSIDAAQSLNILGTLNTAERNAFKPVSGMLQKRIDGIFDTDGKLLYNYQLKKMVYVYYYRNQAVIASSDLKTFQGLKTIDTVSQVPIQFAYLHTTGEKKFAKQPPMIQQGAATYGKYLFTMSNRLGKFEAESMLKEASIIDVYDLQKSTYEFSFYLYNYKNEKVENFQIYNNLLIGITKHYIVIYRLKSSHFDLK
ncbi:MauE/DoxX family redox-associated membrane protein [Flavobacterium sp. ZB4P13]|uniref:MauE/DoxX family redox-associated membrane protein n=1 Tax=Flavobacterium sp. ZB4P13 TaxID=3401728 RepID=UPI003AAC75BD